MPTRSDDTVYIPSIGKAVQLVNLFSFSKSIDLGPSEQVVWKPEDDTAIDKVGAFIDTDAYRVWQDSVNAGGDDVPHGTLLLLPKVGAQSHVSASLAVFHLRYFWPQLHDLRVPVSLRAQEELIITAPPLTTVTLSGVCKRPIRK